VVHVDIDNNVDADNNVVNDYFSATVVAVSQAVARPYHHGNLREELLERAEEIVRSRGVAELSLRELARDVGVSHGAPRRHFTDRQALLDALALRGFERLEREIAAAATGRASFQTRMSRTAATYVRFATRDSALLELMFAGKHRDPGGQVQETADRAFAAIADLIAEGQAAGRLVGTDPMQPGLVIWAALQGLATLTNGGMLDQAHLDAVVTETMRHLMHGLEPR
jgi:AcrR family transcriptional regulator